MKISSILIALSILLILSPAQAEVTDCPRQGKGCEQKSTVLTFYIEQQAQQAEDYIEMALTILEKDNSLRKALDKAKSRAAAIKNVATAYCNNNGGEDCENSIEVGKHQITPIYQTVRRQPIFSGFSVTQEAVMQIKKTDNIGELVDSILSIGVHQIDKFEWKPEVEADAEQIAIDQGISQAKDLCHHINRQIGQILAIEEVFSTEEQEQGEQQADESEEQQQQKPSILKFVVQCVPKNGQQPDFTPEDLQIKEQPKQEPTPDTKQKKKKKKKKE